VRGAEMQFRALTDLYLNTGVYVQAGTTFDGPAGWTPSANACEPLDNDALTAYRQAGPHGCLDAEWQRAIFTNSARWAGIPVPAPVTRWVANGDGTFSLGGIKSNPT